MTPLPFPFYNFTCPLSLCESWYTGAFFTSSTEDVNVPDAALLAAFVLPRLHHVHESSLIQNRGC